MLQRILRSVRVERSRDTRFSTSLEANGERKRVVIIGAGFGGLSAAKALGRADLEVTLVDQRNHHLFQPLLYQVATAGLSPADIAAPIRHILRDQKNTRVLLDRVTGVNAAARLVLTASGASLSYDWLIIATGARHSYFGRDDWAEHAPGIKSIDDATAVRRKVLLALERAETETDEARRKALLTFVVIGGGPTGVEMAGAIAELARKSVSRDFRTITPHCSRVILIEGGSRLLASFPETLSARARHGLEQLGVEVKLSGRVTAITPTSVQVGEDIIPAHTAIWAAGVQASPASTWLRCACDRAGKVLVNETLRPPGHDNIFVIGDTAACPNGKGGFVPGIAPVAKQQGRHVARAILMGRAEPFRYRSFGNLATVGRRHAVIDFGRIRIHGFLAWLLWSVAHIWFLIGFRSRIIVGLNWAWNYLTFGRSARLITGYVAPDFIEERMTA
ncbi:NAD(P)/FAD-dependent oxidoreductase [Sphingomonas sp. ID1715]|uniref:NAD(P)/FAD-dependent oxidoreductase n=1 Tax=Sphingomonas sp. ID1715 TaxID=1656898 RepID=UPI0014895C5E|nr:NAD(P)/FAD-dependent oxidoreductase [Sphingomonas sp. ID1715]NNM76479.1 NAD(P)/FAD-dependent oxidoreductase [Sphingomonas sp. ID1715]